MIGDLLALRGDLESLRTAFGGALRVGAVHAVDAEKGYRVKWGEGPDGPFLSPWYPHPESGGTNSTWVPLSVGQVVGVINPSGDPRQGVLVRGGFSGVNPPISSDLEEVAVEFPGVRISIRDGAVTVTAEGRVVVNSPDVQLGGEGGPAVARVGDPTSDGAVIVGGSSKVFAV